MLNLRAHASSTRMPSVITSVPMPSPGITAMRWLAMSWVSLELEQSISRRFLARRFQSCDILAGASKHKGIGAVADHAHTLADKIAAVAGVDAVADRGHDVFAVRLRD